MNSRYAVAFALVAALVFGGLGYLFGIRAVTADNTLVAAAAEAPAGALTDAQEEAVRALIREHLIENPEIIRDAIDALQRKEQEAAKAAQVSMITDEADRLFNSDLQVVLGNPKGDVTLVEFFDYNCGFCKRAHADMERLLDEDQNLRLVLKEFPVLGQGSLEAAHIAAAVNMIAPEKYREFHENLLMAEGQADGAKALAVAEDLGLDTAKLRQLADSDDTQAVIAESYELANKLSLTGTPSYVTKNGVVIGAVGYDALKAEIEAVRACATAEC